MIMRDLNNNYVLIKTSSNKTRRKSPNWGWLYPLNQRKLSHISKIKRKETHTHQQQQNCKNQHSLVIDCFQYHCSQSLNKKKQDSRMSEKKQDWSYCYIQETHFNIKDRHTSSWKVEKRFSLNLSKD